MQEYVRVSREGMLVEVRGRAGEGRQAEVFAEAEERRALASAGVTLTLNDIYRSVRFGEEA